MAHGHKTGGRVAGTPNRSTASVRAIAGQYSAEAISTLVQLMRHSEDDRTRLVAAKELLDRGHGRPGPAPPEVLDVPQEPQKVILQWAEVQRRLEELSG